MVYPAAGSQQQAQRAACMQGVLKLRPPHLFCSGTGTFANVSGLPGFILTCGQGKNRKVIGQ